MLVDSKYIITEWIPEDDYEEDPSLPELTIESISRKGLVVIKFSDKLIVPRDIKVLTADGPILRQVTMPNVDIKIAPVGD